ncbi:general L-amino acid ABC transporter membrane protein [Faunimonas pinastri]|uniref:General L-amino acid ABC transporter membrane protein n=1 Tax=Faunimonas pinastri TaxID=1855383 RepID=A0A1H9CJ94_9HYPH|nr:amino acid ABC transporter permease [Faunimonas pinastri]SEQ01300.1 general L-amino acid ABC transporter membrane protein [Faunimonas pinastri]
MTIQATSPSAPRVERPARSSFLNDPDKRGYIIQAVLLVLVVAFIWWLGHNTAQNLQRLHIASGFGFLNERAGFNIGQSLIPYSGDRSYGYALLVGIINTIEVAILGIVIATIVGVLVGVGRLSSNWLIRQLATVYVELFRNIPPLLVIFFWYFGVLAVLPNPRDAINLGLGFSLSNRGLFTPKPIFEHGALYVGIAILVGIVAAWALSRWATARQMRTGQQFPSFWAGLAVIVVLGAASFAATGAPLHFDIPVKTRFNLNGGSQLGPELVSLLLALAIYTASFIAEIVRAGILSVSHGQTEAAYSLGLKVGPTMRKIILPQALRVVIPPLTSEYLNLMKNTSLAVAIGFADLVAVGGSILNQTGQSVEVVLIWMLVYLGLSLIMAVLMNWYNRKMALVER